MVVGNLIIVVFKWALGSPIDYFELKWIKEKNIIRALGRYFAQFHKISKKFGKEYPEKVKAIQKWDEIHCSILKGTKLHEDDISVLDDP